MRLPELCIRRPVFATMLVMTLIVIGVVSYFSMKYTYFPTVTLPTISVSTNYTGASAQFMADEVTKKEEDAITNIDGIDYISATSSNGNSSITIMLNDSVPYLETVNKVRNKIAAVQSKLPPGLDTPPSVSDNTGTTWGSIPVLTIAFIPEGKQTNIDDVYSYLNNSVLPQLQNIPGVGSTPIHGASSVAMRVWLDVNKMAMLGITTNQVTQVLQNNNASFSAGAIQNGEHNYILASTNTLNTPEDFGNLIIRYTENNPIRLKDIAHVAWGNTSLNIAPVYFNKQRALSLQIRPFKNANPIQVSKLVLDKINHSIKPNLPPGIKLKISYNQATYINQAIQKSFHAVFEAVILVSIIILIFLGSLRAAIIPVITIPVCMIATLAIMNALGFSINIVTLMAIILAIGLVVDDAIVVLENSHRYIELGSPPFLAAINGSKNITFAVVAMTMTLVSVYLPLLFSSGISGVVFKQFGITLAGAVVISGFVALTLSPLMCSRLLQEKNQEKGLFLITQNWFRWIAKKYAYGLKRVIGSLPIFLIGFSLLILFTILLFNSIKQEFIPKEDTGYLTTSITEPVNSNQNFINNNMSQVDNVIYKDKNIENNMSYWIEGGATNFITLVPWNKRKNTPLNEVIQNLNDQLSLAVPNLGISVSLPDPVDYGYGQDNFIMKLSTLSRKSSDLIATNDKVLKLLKAYPGLKNVRSSLVFNTKQYNVIINQEKIAKLGVDPTDVRNTLSQFMSGDYITDMHTKDNNIYPVYIQAARKYLNNFDVLKDIRVKASDGSLLPLSQFVTLKSVTAQPSIQSFNRKISANITADFVPGYTASDVVAYINKAIKPILKNGESYAFVGALRQQGKSQNDSTFYFILGLIFIYMILAAQFESFTDPFIIILTVPLSLFGALLSLKLTGATLNLFTNIGLLTLVGLVTKQGILLVKFANEAMENDVTMTPFEAMVQSAKNRLRPILMTSITMVLGALPMALAVGPGSNAHSQIGWTLVGGLIIGTLFTLFFVPMAYGHLKTIQIRLTIK